MQQVFTSKVKINTTGISSVFKCIFLMTKLMKNYDANKGDQSVFQHCYQHPELNRCWIPPTSYHYATVPTRVLPAKEFPPPLAHLPKIP